METPFSGSSFRPEELYAASAGRFFELLKSLAPAAATPGTGRDWSQLAGPLAAQFEQWLRLSQSAGPWFGAGVGSPAGAGVPGAAPNWSFGPLPLGAAAVPRPEAERVWELATRLGQLQTQLAVHWGEVARAAAQRFVTRAGALSGTPSLEQTLKLYELWVACAEEAYGATARSEAFSRLQSELANVSAALL
ncbi:MAG TPA: poly(R)-hydroxyalkanoic acid synthase subunit PhaE, partial [Steroidobacteraceae bacterium]|nr:poly(R)-hydroxyalkanoic acid synthase subunit PhaE [Steroidobacteraceae bacterium]